MSYRDDLAASQARVAALERQLADANTELDELKAGDQQALVKVGGQALTRADASSPAASRWLGAPTKLELVRELDGELPESAYTELVECMRRIIGRVGTVTSLPGSFAWSVTPQSNDVGPQVNIYLTIRDGKTVIRGEEQLDKLAWVVVGGISGGVGLGGIIAPIATLWITPWLLPLTVPLWLGGIYAGSRKVFRRVAKQRATRLEQLLDELVAIAERRIAEHEATDDE